MSLCKLVTQSGGSAQSTGDSLVVSMDKKVEHKIVMSGVKEENSSEGESHGVGDIKIKQEAQEDTGEVTPVLRPLLLPTLDIKPERDWKPEVRAAFMETMDVLRHPALPGRSDLSQNEITLYRSEEVNGVRWQDYHEEQRAILRVSAILNLKKEIKNDQLFNAFLPMHQTMQQPGSVNLAAHMKRSPTLERVRKVDRHPCVAGPARGWLTGPSRMTTFVRKHVGKQRKETNKKTVKTEHTQSAEFIEGGWTVEDSRKLQESIQQELLRLHSIKVQDKDTL